MKTDLSNIKRVHFIGIGGIGVSAIARLMHILGKEVSGSDISESRVTQRLRQYGICISIGHDTKNIEPDTDLVVHTIAAREDNPEILEAHVRGIRVATYPQMLSVVSKSMQTIAVSGTHGKTTTTAMLSRILSDAHRDPTVVVGSFMKDFDSNVIVGKSDYFIVEACEYRRSFLNIYPKILVITNIDEDHLDYYRDITDIQSAFRELVMRIPKDGALICNVRDPLLQPVLRDVSCRIIDYGTFIHPSLKLKAPGGHNRQNAAACLAVADFLGIEKSAATASLENFTGTWRRFDLKGTTPSGAVIYDDYAHHPNEIRATLAGMKELYPNKKRVAFFQPHLFSRTKTLLREFSEAFSDADAVYLLPIYASREGFDQSITSEMLTERIREKGGTAFYLENFNQAAIKVKQFGGDAVVVMMGAGDIYALSESVLQSN